MAPVPRSSNPMLCLNFAHLILRENLPPSYLLTAPSPLLVGRLKTSFAKLNKLNLILAPAPIKRSMYLPQSQHVSSIGSTAKFSAHPRISRTIALINRRFWWPSIHKDVKEFVLAWSFCARNKPSHQPPSSLLQPLSIPKVPGHTFPSTLSLDSQFLMNQELESTLRCFTSTKPSDWSQYIPWVEYGHNSHISIATGFSPFEVSLGYQLPLFPSDEKEIFVKSFQHCICSCKNIWNRSITALNHTTEQNRRYAHCKRTPASQYSPREKIWLFAGNIPLKSMSKKILPQVLQN